MDENSFDFELKNNDIDCPSYTLCIVQDGEYFAIGTFGIITDESNLLK